MLENYFISWWQSSIIFQVPFCDSFFLVTNKLLLYLIFPKNHSVAIFSLFPYPKPHEYLTNSTGMYPQCKIIQKRRVKKWNILPSQIALTHTTKYCCVLWHSVLWHHVLCQGWAPPQTYQNISTAFARAASALASVDFKPCFSCSVYVCPCSCIKNTDILCSLLPGNLIYWICQHNFSTFISKKFIMVLRLQSILQASLNSFNIWVYGWTSRSCLHCISNLLSFTIKV